MSAPTSDRVMQLPTQSGLLCRLRACASHCGSSPTAGEIELENIAADTFEIDVRSSPLEYLNLLVSDAKGGLVSESHYGDQFSPLFEPYILQLRAGEKYVAPVSLLANVPENKRLPGKYVVQAVFECRELRAITEPVVVIVPSKGK